MDPLTPRYVAVAVLLAAAGLVVLTVLAGPTVGLTAFALFALAGAGARVFTPLGRSFVVRRRAVDVSVLLVLGLSLAYIVATTPLV